MKLTDLIEALAVEVDIMQPELESLADNMLSADIEQLTEFLDNYNELVVRLGETGEMVGFVGITKLSNKVQENTLLLLSCDHDDSSKELIAFLRTWSNELSQFLHSLSDEDLSLLLDKFSSAPFPLSDAESEEIRTSLSEIIEQAKAGGIFHDEDSEDQQTEALPEDVDLELPEDIDQNLMDGFLQESPELASLLLEWAKQISSGAEVTVDDLQRVKRYTHTLKGTGATIGVRGLASIGHRLEDLLEYLESYPTHINDSIKDLLLDSAYCIDQIIGYIAQTDDEPDNALEILQDLLDITNKIYQGESLEDLELSSNDSLANDVSDEIVTDNNTVANEVKQQETSVQTQTVTPVPQVKKPQQPSKPTRTEKQTAQKDKNATLRIAVDKIDELFRVSSEVSINSSAMEDSLKRITEQMNQLLDQNVKVQKRLFELETLVSVRSSNLFKNSRDANKVQEGYQDFDSLEMDEYNELHSSVHALMEESADVRIFTHQLKEQIASLSSLQSLQQVLSRDTQHLVISTRMSEVGELESRLQRNIRTASKMTGKSVVLHMTGQDTLIDSDLISKLSDPLLHLLRNAVDHGIEKPEVRTSKGKEPTGNVYLDFFRQGQQVVLQCHDDGQGLDLESIYAQALEQGLIDQDQQLSDDEMAQLILKSGFSSRTEVSELSGRGVGLDVVSDWASRMTGNLSVSTSPYGGCLFELRFSASLSTIQSLIVSIAGDKFFAIPAVQVEQAVSHSLGEFSIDNEQLLYNYEDEQLEAFLLADLIELPVDRNKDLNDYCAVIVVANNKRYVIAVDELLHSRELFMTPPDRFTRHLQGVSGFSVLGNGAIAVNLDINQLLSQDYYHRHRIYKESADDVQTAVQRPKVLIVDDSLTVRDALQEFIQDIGLEPYTARDGIEAVKLLEEMTPNIVLTDMEMPNMNGVELTKYIRAREDIKDLPILMITSRSQTKHRNLALDAGVNECITKPYSEDQLLESIQNFL